MALHNHCALPKSLEKGTKMAQRAHRAAHLMKMWFWFKMVWHNCHTMPKILTVVLKLCCHDHRTAHPIKMWFPFTMSWRDDHAMPKILTAVLKLRWHNHRARLSWGSKWITLMIKNLVSGLDSGVDFIHINGSLL
jgi:hypothetical protein